MLWGIILKLQTAGVGRVPWPIFHSFLTTAKRYRTQHQVWIKTPAPCGSHPPPSGGIGLDPSPYTYVYPSIIQSYPEHNHPFALQALSHFGWCSPLLTISFHCPRRTNRVKQNCTEFLSVNFAMSGSQGQLGGEDAAKEKKPSLIPWPICINHWFNQVLTSISIIFGLKIRTVQASLLTSFHRNENCSYRPHSPASKEPPRRKNCQKDWYRKNDITQMPYVLYICLSCGDVGGNVCVCICMCMYMYTYVYSCICMYMYV